MAFVDWLLILKCDAANASWWWNFLIQKEELPDFVFNVILFTHEEMKALSYH